MFREVPLTGADVLSLALQQDDLVLTADDVLRIVDKPEAQIAATQEAALQAAYLTGIAVPMCTVYNLSQPSSKLE